MNLNFEEEAHAKSAKHYECSVFSGSVFRKGSSQGVSALKTSAIALCKCGQVECLVQGAQPERERSNTENRTLKTHLNRRGFIAAFAMAPAAALAGKSKADASQVFGKIQFVTSFPDYKVQVVDSFPDLKVQVVDAFPDKPGKWQIVNSFPDYKIQIVSSFPDFKIQFVTSFPGVA